ncbi:hypothetical protein HK105_202615 [Polyrhizophydium stewartii]|uniref:Phospholipase C n=1 Tax=Polyrhizophydium stewartii TaxID=2732419 RepID=A0ABR4NE34_9FUNG
MKFAVVSSLLIAAVSAGPIQNVIVLVMENRSFDSFLGRLKWDGINPNVNGLTGNEFNWLNGNKVFVSKVTAPAAGYDPDHETSGMTREIYNVTDGIASGRTPSMGGFAAQAYDDSSKSMDAVTQVMGAFGPDALPVTYALAQEFAIIQDWHASVPGPTYPNRHFVHAATAQGRTDNSGVLAGISLKTIFDNLSANKVTWSVYADGTPSSLLLYTSFRLGANSGKILNTARFLSDAKAGKLPQYSFLDPNFSTTDNHPPHNLNAGEAYVKKLYEAVRASPQWNQTLFLITYDENGGFYDHVVPPTGVPIPDDSKLNPAAGDFKFDRLGVRVPTILISPLVPKGGVFQSTVPGRNYEHSSISATLKKLFNLPSFLTKRDAWALPFDSLASLSTPRTDCIVTLPTPKSS